MEHGTELMPYILPPKNDKHLSVIVLNLYLILIMLILLPYSRHEESNFRNLSTCW